MPPGTFHSNHHTTPSIPTNYPHTNRTWDKNWNGRNIDNVSPINPGTPRKIEVSNPPKVHLSMTALQQIWAWTDAADEEWSGLGYVREELDEDQPIIHVESIYLVKQTNSTADTKMDPKDVNRLIGDLLNDGKDPKWLRCWIHSHGTGPIFWSGTDEKTCATYGDTGYMISIVVNKHRHLLARLNLYTPMRLTVDAIPVVYELTNESVSQRLKEEYDAMAIEDPYYYYNQEWQRGSSLSQEAFETAELENPKDKRINEKKFMEMTDEEWWDYCTEEWGNSDTYMGTVAPLPTHEIDIREVLDSTDENSLNEPIEPCFGLQWSGVEDACNDCIYENECIKEMIDTKRLNNNYDYTDKGLEDWKKAPIQ